MHVWWCRATQRLSLMAFILTIILLFQIIACHRLFFLIIIIYLIIIRQRVSSIFLRKVNWSLFTVWQKCLKIVFNLNVHVNMKALFVSCCCTQVYEHCVVFLASSYIAKCFDVLINWYNVTRWSCCSFFVCCVRFCCSTVWLGGVGLNIWNTLGLLIKKIC